MASAGTLYEEFSQFLGLGIFFFHFQEDGDGSRTQISGNGQF